jgi:hypothetical protein
LSITGSCAGCCSASTREDTLVKTAAVFAEDLRLRRELQPRQAKRLPSPSRERNCAARPGSRRQLQSVFSTDSCRTSCDGVDRTSSRRYTANTRWRIELLSSGEFLLGGSVAVSDRRRILEAIGISRVS